MTRSKQDTSFYLHSSIACENEISLKEIQCGGLSITSVLRNQLHVVNFIQWKLLPM